MSNTSTSTTTHHHQVNNNKGKYSHLKHKHFPRVLQNKAPSSFDVYTQNGDAVYSIKAEDVLHLPPDYEDHYAKGHNQHNNHRLTLCPHFHSNLRSSKSSKKNNHQDHQEQAAVVDPFCPLGERCSHVHAVLENASVNNEIHFNFAYKNLQDVKYDRYAFDTPALRVAPPNETAPVEDLPAHLCIKTKAYIGRDRITSHCAHYYFNRICNRGSECFFVHAVSLEQPSSSSSKSSTTTASNDNENKQQQDEEFSVPSGFRRIYGRTEPLRAAPSSVKKTNKKSSNNNNNNNQKKEQQQQVNNTYHHQNEDCNKVHHNQQEQQQQQQPHQPRQQSFATPVVVVPNIFPQQQQRPIKINPFAIQQPQQPQHAPRVDSSFRRHNSNHSSSSSASRTPNCETVNTPTSSFSGGYDEQQQNDYYYYNNNNNNNNNNQGCNNKNQNNNKIYYNNNYNNNNQQQQRQSISPNNTTTSTTNSPRCPCVGCKKFVHNPYSWTQTTVCLSRVSPTSNSSF